MESQSLRVVVEDLPSYRAYRVLMDQLTEGAGATRAVPVELSAGRAVLAVDAGLPPGRLAARLENAAARAGLPLEVLGIEAAGLRLRVGEPRPQGDAASAIDRSGRNRY